MKLLSAIPVLCFSLVFAPTIIADLGPFEKPPRRNVKECLPEHLIKGENYKVKRKVTWSGGLHEFTVKTKFGDFEVWGEPMLRVRLAEVDAWVALEATSSAEVGMKSVGRSAVRTVSTLANAFAHPIKTVTGVPTGVSRLFRKAEHTVENVGDAVTPDEEKEGTEGKEQQGESDIATLGKKLIGINSAYRRLAKEYGVNPYTTNEAVQDELLRLAKVEAAAGKSTQLLLPGLGTAASIMSRVAREIYEESWLEIVSRNENSLVELGASPDQIKALFNNDAINLTLQTLMIEVLGDLPETRGRIHLVDQMIALRTDAEAVFYAESLMMADFYNENEKPIEAFLPGMLIPVAITTEGDVVVFSAADYAYWTEDEAEGAADLTELYKDVSPNRVMWVADQASPRFIEGMAGMGWSVRANLRSTILPEIPWGLSDDPPAE